MNRTIPGILLALGWLLLLVLGSFQLFWGVMVVIGFLGSREYGRMAFADYLYESDRILLPLLIILPIITALFCRTSAAVVPAGLLLGFIGLALYVFFHYQRFETPLMILSRGALGLICIGFLAAHLILLRGLADGASWLIILTAITAGSDTGAYYVGSRLGKRKLCPNISPNKTVEGGMGGIAGGVVAGVVLAFIFPVSAPLWGVAVLAVLLSVAGMMGDLVESVIKRGYQVKDSGTLLGGHGGVLDRVDSLLMAAPVLYYMLIYSGF
ncbi:MAG: phosphatidate cytidylyltransferase [Desulfofustis sp.]|nr:phosphatidate cytidylyltransferase [Desulfofustis sp.]MBT8347010.1 phosphatidate cytidylyltransferase [Desulfofustis sp.]NNK58451.1 CDP-archaeol synthase [Desulfofustis sp.]